ncbi:MULTISPECIES: hypothetical protein [Nocardiaceae]|uniref:hypothetical protein n=1 Tax=Nocardiaceae TaxID=85025 RepID=UPI003787C6CF
MNKEEITAQLRAIARDFDDLLENLSTGKKISDVLAASRKTKAAARAAGMTEGEIDAALESGLS